MKKLGFNAETVCLIMLPDYFYDIADEEGMLLWQEYPTWHATFDRKDAATYIPEFKAFFRRDRMHPAHPAAQHELRGRRGQGQRDARPLLAQQGR